jgi:hypothetical protein
VSVEVVVSELGDGAAPSLGSFDGDVTFDPGLLTYDDVAFGSELGDPVTEALVSADVVGGGDNPHPYVTTAPLIPTSIPECVAGAGPSSS